MQDIIAFGLTKAELLIIFVGFWSVVAVVAMMCSYFSPDRPSRKESEELKMFKEALKSNSERFTK
jgi:preprotein translocase subunit YajC